MQGTDSQLDHTTRSMVDEEQEFLDMAGNLSPGTKVGSYVIQRELGQGGYGVVYLGERARDGHRAAIKVLRTDVAQSRTMIERFIREAQAIEQIDHPSIVDMYEFGRLPDGRPFYVMELLAGRSLREQIKNRGAMSLNEMIAIIEPVCAGLGAAHEAGYVHRDLKSSNVMMSDDGQRVTLLDFGIAKLMQPAPGQDGLTSVGRTIGTPHAMSPEQIIGEPVDARSDIYALGVLCYELLTAQWPFRATSWPELEWMHLNAPPSPPSDLAPVPPAVDAVILRCLEKQPGLRFESTSAFMQALRDSAGLGASGAVAATHELREALGLLIEIRPLEVAQAEIADELIDRLLTILTTSEASLREHGFDIALMTNDLLLAARPLVPGDPAGDPADTRAIREQAIALACDLYDAFQGAPGEAGGLFIAIALHIDTVVIESATRSIVGGDLVDISHWPSRDACGVYATPLAIAELTEPRVTVLST